MLLFFAGVSAILHLAYSKCTPPFEIIDGGCYFFSGGLYVESYDDADSFCQSIGGYLAMIKGGEENRAIFENFLIGTEAEVVLLGAKRNELSLFEWLDGTLVRDGFESWADNQPDGSGDCMGYVDAFNMLWDDFACGNFSNIELFVGFLCEEVINVQSTTTTEVPTTTTTPQECTEPFVNLYGIGCYLYVDTQVTYAQADQSCKDLNSHLAYITSAEEQAVLEPYVEALNDGYIVYLGGYDLYLNDTMFWLDGSPVDAGYTNYYEAAVSGGNDNALCMDDLWFWQWGDVPDDFTLPFLCERDL